MVIECRDEATTECGWPQLACRDDPLFLSLREKGQDAEPKPETLSRFDCPSMQLRVGGRVPDECSYDYKNCCSEGEIQIVRVCTSWGQFGAWVPG